MFVGFRLNQKKDRDIIDALSNAKNRTEEIKRLLRLGIQVSNGLLAPTTSVKSVKPEAPPLPVARKSKGISSEELKKNIMSSFKEG